MNHDDIRNRFTFHPPPTPDVAVAHDKVRGLCLTLAFRLDDILPECDEKKRAIDALDDTMKHANAAIARHQEVA